MNVVACIPCRFDSKRLPGKPLRQINGKPLVQHVIERTLKAKTIDDVIVLTDDERIFNAVNDMGYKVCMTAADCKNGTERIIDYLYQQNSKPIVVNVQGDEVVINPQHIDQLVNDFLSQEKPQMATLAYNCSDKTVMQDHNTVKLVVDQQQRALYFSRQCLPLKKCGELPDRALMHMGIYIYHPDTLFQLAELPPAPLELIESLEQLRALSHGIAINVSIIENHQHLAIDTADDLEKASELIAALP